MVSIVVGTLGPDLMITILQNSHGNGNDPEAHLDYENQEWRVAALMTAAYLGRIKDIKKILALGGADLHNLTVANGDNVVHFAALGGHAGVVVLRGRDMQMDVVDELLSCERVDVNIADGDGDVDPIILLVVAAATGHENIFRSLLAHPRVHIWVPTLFRRVITGGNVDILKAMIALTMGADLQKYLMNGNALLLAAELGTEEVLRYLLSFDEANQDPLDAGVVAALLVHPDIDVNARDLYQRTPLAYAAVAGQTQMVNILVAQQGVDVSPVDRWGMTPLHYAAENGHLNVVRMLFDAPGTNVWHTSIYDKTPLALAAGRAYLDIVKLLLDSRQEAPGMQRGRL
ncbi:hypothetical protein IFM47457_02115 [Aspergillus lentulus]|nr:hypothetical protein IFM47457_02115 [Aspergillus lentulus]